MGGTRRFGQLRASVSGISQKVLTQNLRDMESDGLVLRKVYAEVPPRVEYSLTPTGHSLLPVIEVWPNGEKNIKKPPRARPERKSLNISFAFYSSFFLLAAAACKKIDCEKREAL